MLKQYVKITGPIQESSYFLRAGDGNSSDFSRYSVHHFVDKMYRFLASSFVIICFEKSRNSSFQTVRHDRLVEVKLKSPYCLDVCHRFGSSYHRSIYPFSSSQLFAAPFLKMTYVVVSLKKKSSYD